MAKIEQGGPRCRYNLEGPRSKRSHDGCLSHSDHCLSSRFLSSGRYAWMLLVVLVLLLPTVSDACGDPPRFETMRLRGAPKPRYRPGERVQYDCRLGFKPIVPLRSRSAVCEDDNTWSALEEACTRKSCPNLGDPVNGQVYFVNGSVLFGSQAHFVCNQGFYMIGARILHCEISENNVNWNDDPPVCEKILCSTPGNIKNGRFTIYKDEYHYNEVVTYMCDPSNGPDEYSLVGESRLICVDQDRWSSDPPECKVVKCDYPVVEHGMILSGFRRKFYYKAQVVFQCNQGFSLHGSNTIVCNANSTWEPEIPTCAKGPRPNTTTVPTSTG
ncbi:PREDICTED: membrane cofactor protein-like [Capra hircus]|uniref:membrane cofactor protein-like n=1 Tax=Capra hircus TaxID=9925 RepID=UPI000847A8FF|nr:PREDICTED: membrane cofactor protein-like [Capra hircus]